MANPRILRVEVVYARRDLQCLVKLELAAGTTAWDAVQLSGLPQKLPEIAAAGCQLGIFGRPVAAQQLLQDGDRVEVYRPLQIDPKQARRRRARRQG